MTSKQATYSILPSTTIPVPRVHEIKRDENGAQVISMDYMPGTRLDKAWPSMTGQQKTTLAQELHDYIQQLRDLEADYIGAAERGKPIIGKYVFHLDGPFDNERQFHQFLFSRSLDTVPDRLRYFATSSFKEDHEIVFTHGDLAPRNILVDEDGHVRAVLNWENAG
ncbi:hypothetical protein SI65_01549 [Aspergillus cristatus]|uniref:non-specific serine/threonine protein kinase n=1 Tax=Aspergillus cristatus TaxID=573508 RepID=A0A1E3BSM6_ASPCR|nr:hypothetical protein SI65_01549 [Aspergillus cristatus]